jgi:hypothetical protein
MSEFKTDQDFELKIFDCCIFDSKIQRSFGKPAPIKLLNHSKQTLKSKIRKIWGWNKRERERGLELYFQKKN